MKSEARCDVSNDDFGYEVAEFGLIEAEMGLMELEAAEQLLNQEIKSLEEKLQSFREGFIRFYGYTPEFFSDLLYVKNLKIKPTL